MTFKRTNNAPTWGGWLFVAMAAGVALLASRAAGATERIGLGLVAAVFATAGVVVVVRRYEQTTRVDRARRRVVIDEHTRFNVRRRDVPFTDIAAVEVESYTDPDPDARPFQTTTHRVVLALRDGEKVAVTDFALDAELTRATRDALAEALRA